MARRVYFAFHYNDVVNFRANVVRNHNMTAGIEKAGYYDASIWEESKKKGDVVLKRMINAELEHTSVTVVLIGSQTFSRRWVKYEIMRSIMRGNTLLGVHINGIVDKNQTTISSGPNPFDHLALLFDSTGRIAIPFEWTNQSWVKYTDLDSFAVSERPQSEKDNIFQLSRWLRVYDWISDRGFSNFETWID